ncbi:MAG: hypothetical protein IKW11_07165 [Bacteroidales bacterium]|nr:hypothetical protein [Bacteroidales bacterium]
MKLIYRHILLLLLLLPSLSMKAQVSEIPDLVLDTMTVSKKTFINDYSMIGVQYGAGLSQVMWNPTQEQEMLFMPYNVGVTYTRYGKMFGYMPYFGFQIGLFYGQEGYKFKRSANGYSQSLYGADKAVFDVVELPFVSHMHIDFWKMKILAEIGFFAGYRLKIHRFPVNDKYNNDTYASLQYSFHETDRRWDYGIKGGLGFGFIFDPIEVHLKATYKHSLSSLYEPDKDSKYYYKFAYPSNIVISAGVHFQLTKRTGKTKPQLKKEAKELVYGTTE